MIGIEIMLSKRENKDFFKYQTMINNYCKKILIFILLSFLSFVQNGFGQSELYVFPNKLLPEDTCKLDINKYHNIIIKKELGDEIDIIKLDNSELKKVDLNGDGKCEILHFFSSLYFGNYPLISIYLFDELDSLVNIGTFLNSDFTFAEPDSNCFCQVINGYYEGEKTNPIHYSRVYRYDGKRYVEYKNPHITKNTYRELGLKFYKERKYRLASTYFHNVLSLPYSTMSKTLDVCNLSIVWIKLTQYEKAIKLIEEYLNSLSIGQNKREELSCLYFNLGLAYEYLGEKLLALKNYKLSCFHKQQPDCSSKIISLTSFNEDD